MMGSYKAIKTPILIPFKCLFRTNITNKSSHTSQSVIGLLHNIYYTLLHVLPLA
jgi:hypothetical protein